MKKHNPTEQAQSQTKNRLVGLKDLSFSFSFFFSLSFASFFDLSFDSLGVFQIKIKIKKKSI